jgi:short-subunit dehydrogenase
LKLLSNPFRALIIGSSGTIGAAFMEALQNNPACTAVIGVHRNSEFPIDYQNPDSIELCAQALSTGMPFQLIINTIGVLHSESWSPEKRLDDLKPDQLIELMKINAIGPALTMKHFAKLLDPAHSVMATISAKVGSIEDN